MKRLLAFALAICVLLSSTISFAIKDDEGLLPFNLRQAFTHSNFTFDDSLADNFNVAMVFNPDTGDVLYQKNEDARFVSGGAIAMMMTANLALQYMGINSSISVTSEVEQLEGNKTVGLKKGDSYRAIELIAAMLLYDARDAAALIAAETAVKSGRIAQNALFDDKLAMAVDMMNEEAVRLNMNQTRYTNAIGLTQNDQRTSVEDTIRLMMSLYLSSSSAYVGDTDYLLGCLLQSGILGQMDPLDPRNNRAPQFSRDICGYGYYTDDNLTVMALSQKTSWRTATREPLDGRVFTVVATNGDNTVTEAMNLLNYARSNFCVLYTKNMVDAMLGSTRCQHCSGTLHSHISTCEYPVAEVETAQGRMAVSVDTSMFAVLTELYTNNNFSTFFAQINDDTVASNAIIKKGDVFATATIYFQGRVFIETDLYVSKERNDDDKKTYVVIEEDANEAKDVPIELIIIFAIGIPVSIWVICTVAITRIRRKKY